MTIHPARLARIRADQERAVTAIMRDESLAHAEVVRLAEDLTDMLNDYTNTHRS